jgi:hypothetical protein
MTGTEQMLVGGTYPIYGSKPELSLQSGDARLYELLLRDGCDVVFGPFTDILLQHSEQVQ